MEDVPALKHDDAPPIRSRPVQLIANYPYLIAGDVDGRQGYASLVNRGAASATWRGDLDRIDGGDVQLLKDRFVNARHSSAGIYERNSSDRSGNRALILRKPLLKRRRNAHFHWNQRAVSGKGSTSLAASSAQNQKWAFIRPE